MFWRDVVRVVRKGGGGGRMACGDGWCWGWGFLVQVCVGFLVLWVGGWEGCGRGVGGAGLGEELGVLGGCKDWRVVGWEGVFFCFWERGWGFAVGSCVVKWSLLLGMSKCTILSYLWEVHARGLRRDHEERILRYCCRAR